MRELNSINETLGPIGTKEEIARCHPEDTVVPMREYNPLTQAWCQDQALDSNRAYPNAWVAETFCLLLSNRVVYDRVTNAFIMCILVDIDMDGVNKIPTKTKVDGLGTITPVRNNDNGTVVTSPNFDFDTADSLTTIDNPMLETGVDLKMFDEIKSNVDYILKHGIQ